MRVRLEMHIVSALAPRRTGRMGRRQTCRRHRDSFFFFLMHWLRTSFAGYASSPPWVLDGKAGGSMLLYIDRELAFNK